MSSKTQARTMLEQMYELILERSQTRELAWDRLVEFVAVDRYYPLVYQLNHRFEWLHQDKGLVRAVHKIYNSGCLTEVFRDELGELYYDLGIARSKPKTISLIEQPPQLMERLNQHGFDFTEESMNILDPMAQTGRLLMAAHVLAPNAVLHGVEEDTRLARIALTNCMMYRMPARILNANANDYETDPETPQGSENWRHSNLWYTPKDKLVRAQRQYSSN